MAGAVIVARNFGDLRTVMPDSKALMQDIGDFVIRKIRTRAEQEQGYQGETFTPLSTGYAKRKAKALGSARADLTVSGRMFNDMQVTTATETSVEIGFISQGGSPGRGGTFIQRSRAVGAADKAFFHITGNHGIIRDFFGVSEEDEDEIVAFIDAELARRTAQL
jgi:hypothetical protein